LDFTGGSGGYGVGLLLSRGPAARHHAGRVLEPELNRGQQAPVPSDDRAALVEEDRFNAQGPDGLFDHWTEGPTPRLSTSQLAELATIVETGPDRKTDGVVRWRRVDLQRVISARFGVDYHQRYVGKLLKKLGFSHVSARPRHPAQDERIVEAFKKTSPTS
jgi:transposase